MTITKVITKVIISKTPVYNTYNYTYCVCTSVLIFHLILHYSTIHSSVERTVLPEIPLWGLEVVLCPGPGVFGMSQFVKV